MTLPASRVVVTVDIEGQPHTMMLDTGASSVTVAASVFADLTKDHRAELSLGGALTVTGASTMSLTRARTVSVGGAEVDGVVVAHDMAFDADLTAISADAGETSEGSLGGTFLTNFYVTIDYPHRTLHLARYSDSSFIYDQGRILGVQLGARMGGGISVAQVFAGSDASMKGVQAGDVIESIDGQALGPLTTSQAFLLLGGKWDPPSPWSSAPRRSSPARPWPCGSTSSCRSRRVREAPPFTTLTPLEMPMRRPLVTLCLVSAACSGPSAQPKGDAGHTADTGTSRDTGTRPATTGSPANSLIGTWDLITTPVGGSAVTTTVTVGENSLSIKAPDFTFTASRSGDKLSFVDDDAVPPAVFARTETARPVQPGPRAVHPRRIVGAHGWRPGVRPR